MRAHRIILAAFVALALGLAAGPAAQADLTYGQVGSLAGEANIPLGVAVDAASGDVYVGNVLFTGVGKYEALGGDPQTLVNLPIVAFSGVAVNPVTRNVYAVNAGGQKIETYEPTGRFLSSFAIAGAGNLFESLVAVQIATDAAGNVYLPNAPHNEVQEFNSEGSELQAFTGSGGNALKEPTGVAVDSEGNVYVADNGNGRVEEFTPAGAFVRAIGTGVDETTHGNVCTAASGDTCGPGSDGSQSVAVDAAGNIFVGENSGSGFHVVRYSPAGEQLADFGLGTIATSEFGTINTLAVNATGLVYVTDGGNNLVRIYAAQSKPAVLNESSVAVGLTTATLKTTIDRGKSDTTYRFEYGTTAAYGASTPAPAADIGAGLLEDNVIGAGQELEGLKPGTTYHYRVAASNAFGETVGADQTFTTLPAQPPTVATGPASGVMQNGATLTAMIDTGGFETVYEFDIGVDTSYGTRIFGDAGLEPGPQTIAAALQGLTPGATYHYRIVATNAFATIYGVDQTFTTASYPTAALSEPETPPLLPTSLLTPTGAGGGGEPTASAASRPSARAARRGKAARRARGASRRRRRSSANSHVHGANRRSK